jgi:hypothetical protein
MTGLGLDVPAILGLGFLLGLQHATDADHVAAVSALASHHRSVVRSALLGSVWGAGHTVALLAAGAATMLLHVTITPGVADLLEGLVGITLVALGGHVVWHALRAATVHRHAHVHDGWSGTRPFLVGLVHGAAGSAALTILVVSTVSSPLVGLLYLAVFGAGSTAGMLILSGLIGLPFVVTAGRSAVFHRLLRVAAGSTSLALGVGLVAGALR